jgi:hypothetical protein
MIRSTEMTPRGGTPQLTFRAGALGPDLDKRVGTSLHETRAAVAQRDLERYYTLLHSGAREVAELQLSDAEASAICDTLNGGLLSAAGTAILDHGPPLELINLVAMELQDADRLNRLGEKWHVDVAQLVTRLRTLTPLGQYALLDAVERFWRDPQRDTAELLREVGLVSSSVL